MHLHAGQHSVVALKYVPLSPSAWSCKTEAAEASLYHLNHPA